MARAVVQRLHSTSEPAGAWAVVQRLRDTGEPAGDELNFRLAGLGDEGATALADVLTTRTMSVARIDLSFNGIGDEGATELAGALKTNACVSELILRGNRIGDAGAKALAGALKSNACVTTLDLARNNCLSDDSVAVMVDALTINTALSELRLDDDFFDERVMSKLALALKANKARHENRQDVSPRGQKGGRATSCVFERIVGSFRGEDESMFAVGLPPPESPQSFRGGIPVLEHNAPVRPVRDPVPLSLACHR